MLIRKPLSLAVISLFFLVSRASAQDPVPVCPEN
jgi:hypothetical protein